MHHSSHDLYGVMLYLIHNSSGIQIFFLLLFFFLSVSLYSHTHRSYILAELNRCCLWLFFENFVFSSAAIFFFWSNLSFILTIEHIFCRFFFLLINASYSFSFSSSFVHFIRGKYNGNDDDRTHDWMRCSVCIYIEYSAHCERSRLVWSTYKRY